MVVRPSLKRVVPGSVPPWRAPCAASAHALKAFFSILCILQVSKSVLLLESKFGLMGAFVTFWDARRPTCWPTPVRGPHRRSQAGGQPPGVADAAGQPAVPAQLGAPGSRRGAGGLVVVRPSLKRVVPGSVPPWRAPCAASAHALKAFFSILCILQVSKSVLLLESKFGLMGAFVTF